MNIFLFKLRNMSALGMQDRQKVVLMRDPVGNTDTQWQTEITSFDKGDIEALSYAIDAFVIANQDVFTPSGALRPKRQRTLVVIDHDANVPLDLNLGADTHVVRKEVEPGWGNGSLPSWVPGVKAPY